ncbi:MAG: acyl-CoA dehydrogenase family protein [Myxococcota bacterium]
MDLGLGELHQAIRDQTRAYAQKELAPRAHALELGGALPEDVRQQLAELGLFGLTIPEDAGGVGLDGVAFALAIEALAEASADVAWRVAVHAGPGVAALAKDELEAFAEGARLASFAEAKEGQAGLAPLPADLLVALDAAGDLHRVEAPVGTPAETLGLGGAGLADVSLEGATPLAGEGTRVRAWADLAAAATMLGAARGAASAATAYAKERTQFGRSLGDFQAIQWKIADAATELDAVRLLVWRAGSSLDAVDAAAARAYAAPRCARACHDALQIHGGYGYTKEYPVERPLRAVRMLARRDAARSRVAAAVIG